ncbi:MAG: prolyl oligopeptidase family serine peptidase [Candidatus Velthaea sp.]
MTVRLFCIAALVLASTAAAPAQRQERRVHGFTSVAISPDGAAVLSVETTESAPDARTTPQPAIVVRDRTTRAKRSIGCSGDDACTLSAPVWSPDGSRIAYLQRDLKTRLSSLWTADAKGGSGKAWLSDFRGVLNAPRWSPDGSAVAVLATAGARKDVGATQAGAPLTGEISAAVAADVQRIATVTADGKLAFASPADLYIYEYDWMPDGRGFAATGAHGNGDNNWWIARLYAIDRASAAARELFAPRLQINAPRVSPDGKHIGFISGLMSDFGSVGGDVFVMSAAGGPPVNLTSGMTATANGLSWNGADDRLTFTALTSDRSAIDTVGLENKTVTTLWSGDRAISADARLRVSVARDGTTSAVVQQSFDQPPEIFTGPLGAWAPLTGENANIAPTVRAQSITWTSDGFAVQGWLLAPRSVTPGKKYPMIVNVHGGPSAAAQPNFVARGNTRDFIEHGYFVFLPNPRGSFGQGEKFTAANVNDFGYGDLRDILRGVDAAEAAAPVDDARLGITGFSYGGYMTMWAVTQTHRFKAAAAGAGIANWISYYGENGIDQWMMPFFRATAYDDPAAYARSSPITFIKNVSTPTFVYVGERDVECPAPQSQEFWHALVTLGVPTSLVIYEGEGHGIRQPAHTRDITQRLLAWFDRYLR